MLRVSRLTDYGTLVMSQMAQRDAQRHSANELAVALHLGLPTVSKVLKRLARHGLVVSIRGQRGGYSLARAPERITLADVLDAIEERPFGLTECSALAGVCDIEDSCRNRANWRSISDVVRRALEAVTLADMVEPRLREHAVELVRARGGAAQPAGVARPGAASRPGTAARSGTASRPAGVARVATPARDTGRLQLATTESDGSSSR
jgi:FeS assembly SUF system regulator